MAQVTLYSFTDVEPLHPALHPVPRNGRDAIPIRRPLNGMQIPNDSPATLQIISKSAEELRPIEIANTSAAGGVAEGTANFFVSSTSLVRREKLQLVQTFLADFPYLFGESPVIYEVRGALIKSKNFPWNTEWLYNYDRYFRATKSVEMAASIFLTIEGVTYEGLMIGCTLMTLAENPRMSPLQFTMLLSNIMGEEPGSPSILAGDSQTDGNIKASEMEYLQGTAPQGRTRSETQFVYRLDDYGNLRYISTERLRDEDLAAVIGVKEKAAAYRIVRGGELIEIEVSEMDGGMEDGSAMGDGAEPINDALVTGESFGGRVDTLDVETSIA